MSHKKLRDEHGVFVAEGPKIVNELLEAPNVKAQQLFAIKSWIEKNNQRDVVEISEAQLQQISSLSTPNSVVGVFHKPVFDEVKSWRKTITLLLDKIQDPGNMGTIIRCADWFGVKQLVCSHECADAFNPKTIQSTMGSISRVKIFYENLMSFVNEHGDVPLYATTLDGESVASMRRLQEAFILIGNESRGISSELVDLAKYRITIPRKGLAESLNAAVATGIILSHVVD